MDSVRLIGSLEPSSATLSSTDPGCRRPGGARWRVQRGRLLGEAQQFRRPPAPAAHQPATSPTRTGRSPSASQRRCDSRARARLEHWFSSRTTHRQPHQTRSVHDGPARCSGGSTTGVGREAEAALRLELADRVHQAEVAFLDEVGYRQAATEIVLRDAHDCRRLRSIIAWRAEVALARGASRSRIFLAASAAVRGGSRADRSAACCRSRRRRRRVRVVRLLRPAVGVGPMISDAPSSPSISE